MTEPLKKLLILSIVFLVSAIAIYFYMDGRNTRSLPAQKANTESNDARIWQLQEQINQLKLKLQDDPHDIESIIQIANNYYDLDQPENAIFYYEQALLLNPADPAVFTDCAVMHFKAGNDDKALEYLDKAIELKPDLAQAWFNKGLILMTAKNEPHRALEVWRKFIEIAPESDQAQFIKSQIEAIESGMIN